MAERKKWKGVDEYYFGLKDVIDKNGGLPRMADWAILGEQVAAVIARKEGVQYKPGSFLEAFDKNLEILNTEALKSSLVAEALIAFMTNRAVLNKQQQLTWEGSMTMLLAELNTFIATNCDSIKINTRARAWPQNPATLGSKIAEIRTNLAPLGIEIESQRGSQNLHYAIRLTHMPTYPTQPTHIRNDEKNVMSVGSVGSVGLVTTPGPNSRSKTSSFEREESSSQVSPITLEEPSRHMTPIALTEKEREEETRAADCDKLVKEWSAMSLLKCPHCKFKNIHQHVVDHHMQYRHGTSLKDNTEGRNSY